MSFSIVLVESHYRSRSWFLALRNIGLTHIISVMPEEFKLFKKSGYTDHNILNLYNDNIINEISNKSISYYEEFLDIKLNSIIYMDRTLRKKNNEYINNYLIFLLNKIDNFFKSVKPKIIFIEPTWTHEIIICKFAKKYKVSIVAPVKDKLLPDRFLAFKDENHLEYYQNPNSENSEQLSKDAFNTVVKDKPVQYFAKFNNRNKLDFKKIPKLYRLLKISILNYRNPNIQSSFLNDVFIKIKSILRSKYQLLTVDFKKLNEISKKYILITLHVQPEASIDVVGTKYSNQIEFIRNISNTTPSKYILLVKEHSHAIGNRPTSFYKSLLDIPNVMLLHPNQKARSAIRNSSLVISNTGTSSFEGAILNIPSVTATAMFFYKILLQKKFNPFEENVSDLLIKQSKLNKSILIKHLEEIYLGSFSGNCGDFQTDSSVLSIDNIEKLKISFNSIIMSIKKQSELKYEIY